MRNINRNMLHMKLNSAVSIFAVAAAFAVLLPPPAYSGVCFLPDCDEDGMKFSDPNIDTKFCEEKGYTYYPTGECPQYYAKSGECSRDDHYLKCDAKTWCEQNGYKTTSCSIPQYVDQPCPSYGSLYKGCKTDNQRACQDLGYKNSCPSGQKLKKTSGRCAYDSSYGTCCKPTGCPSYTSTSSSSYGTNGTDGCEYSCYYTCNMNCPSSYPYSSDPTGCSSRTTNGCGNKSCYNYVSCCTPSCSSTFMYESARAEDSSLPVPELTKTAIPAWRGVSRVHSGPSVEMNVEHEKSRNTERMMTISLFRSHLLLQQQTYVLPADSDTLLSRRKKEVPCAHRKLKIRNASRILCFRHQGERKHFLQSFLLRQE